MAEEDDIEARLVRLALRVLELSEQMPQTPEGDHLARQMIRSATSAALHYIEARGIEGRDDQIPKAELPSKN